MKLTDFFAPINLTNITIFFLVFIIFDAIGSFIAKIIKDISYLRPVYWSWGLGIFVFLWFILHFFIPFWPIYVWISLIVFGIIFLPGYIKDKSYITLIIMIAHFPYPLIFLMFIVKPLFFLLSAPPYYTDELAYHFFSPSQLFSEINWSFISGQGLYNMVPKFLNTSYWLMFSLSKTYATARVLHFLLVFSAIYAISLFLKKKMHIFSGILYSFFALLMSSYFIEHSTLGYVDAGAAAFANLFLIIVVDFLREKKKNLLLAGGIIFGLTIGMKYTILAFLGSILVVSLILFIISGKAKKFITENLKYSVFTFILAIVFGGYWYLKNLILTGNPIFPFLLKCFHSLACGTGYDFFASWSTPMDGLHFDLIRGVLFQGNMRLFSITVAFLVFCLVISFILRLRLLKLLSLLIPAVIFWEILLSKNISGFELRYFFHWVLLIPLVLVLPFGIYAKANLLSKNFKIMISIVLTILVFSSAGLVVVSNIRRLYAPDFVPGFIRNYAMRRTNLSAWIDYYAPQTNEIIKWCGESHPMQNLLLIDPSLIWSGYELRAFMVNCTLNIIGPGKDTDIDEYATQIRKKFNNAYLVSLNRCDTQKPDLSFQPDLDMIRRHEANMKLICSAPEILKNLYVIK